MAGDPPIIDFTDPRLQSAAGQHHFEPATTRSRASSNVRDEGYRTEQNRYGPPQQSLGEAAPSAFRQSEPHTQVPPELIAQITANVINQLKTTGIDAVSSAAPATTRYQPSAPPPPPPPVQWAAPLSPSTDPAASSPTYARSDHTPPSPPGQADIPRTGSPPSQAPILQPDPMYSREPLGGPFQPRSSSAPLSEHSDSAYLRPKGPSRLSTGKEETTLEKIWGPLFDEDCNPTLRLGQLLRGLAVHIIEDYEPRNSIVITPAKMLQFYEDVKLPSEMYPWSSVFDDDRCSISRIYRELGCQHHLVQEHDDERPEIPSLTPVGFQRWATLLIQAHPDEEYDRLQKAVRDMPISNPDEKKERFPKECSRRLFPNSADLRLRERLEKAITKHAKVDLHPHRGGSQPHRSSVGTDSVPAPASATARPSTSAETSYLPSTHRLRTHMDADSTTPSAFVASIERERAPYSNVPAESIIDDTNPPSTPSQPLERERKPYTAVPGGGKAYDEDGQTRHAQADSMSAKIGRSNSTTKARPLSIGVMGPRSMDAAPLDGQPYYPPPPTNPRRRRSPSFSQPSNDFRRVENDFRRPENDARGYASPFQVPPGPGPDGLEDEARRYSRDRPRRPLDDDGRDYGDSSRTRYERGSYANEEYNRTDGRTRGVGYDYPQPPYGGSVYR